MYSNKCHKCHGPEEVYTGQEYWSAKVGCKLIGVANRAYCRISNRGGTTAADLAKSFLVEFVLISTRSKPVTRSPG
jgi:hypothetical protein